MRRIRTGGYRGVARAHFPFPHPTANRWPTMIPFLQRRWIVIDADGHRRTVYIALGATFEEMHSRFPDARSIEPVETRQETRRDDE